jgi:hypothetical protein
VNGLLFLPVRVPVTPHLLALSPAPCQALPHLSFLASSHPSHFPSTSPSNEPSSFPGTHPSFFRRHLQVCYRQVNLLLHHLQCHQQLLQMFLLLARSPAIHQVEDHLCIPAARRLLLLVINLRRSRPAHHVTSQVRLQVSILLPFRHHCQVRSHQVNLRPFHH